MNMTLDGHKKVQPERAKQLNDKNKIKETKETANT
jgi:hypothetical protein